MEGIKKIYLIPGLATDKTVYKNLQSILDIPSEVIEFKPLDENDSLHEYAEKMSQEIDDSEPFALIGTSFGGILAMEIAKIKHPEKIVIISSAKNREELSPIMRLKGGKFFLSLIPNGVLKQMVNKGFHISSLIKKSYRDIYNPETKAMVAKSEGAFDKWIMQQINDWDSDYQHQNLLHIHGDKDIVFPIKYIGNAYVIKGGGHPMVMNRYEEIGKVINDFLHSKSNKKQPVDANSQTNSL